MNNLDKGRCSIRSMENSYVIVYRVPIEEVRSSLQNIGIDNFIPLTDQSGVIYTPENYNIENLNNAEAVDWWQEYIPMSSLINITNNVANGINISTASGIGTFNNPYINLNGEGILVAIIDSGINYLHPDFIKEDGTSKIVSMWNQDCNKSTPPQGMIFGSEYSREEINEAIRTNNSDLCIDTIGTGTMAAGIIASSGNVEDRYRGIAPNVELVVVKLRPYESVYKRGGISYRDTDFFAAISYVISVANSLNMPLIINLSVGDTSASLYNVSILNSFTELYQSGIVLVSGAGNEGNTDTHYSGQFDKGSDFDRDEYQDIILENGDGTDIDVNVHFLGADKVRVALISPSGEISKIAEYSPENPVYNGSFNIENASYSIEYILPWLLSGGTFIRIKIRDIKPGIWTIRIIPEYIINGNYNIYLPNRNIIPTDTRFLDADSTFTITRFGLLRDIITVGVYNERTNSMWLSSSKGPHGETQIKPDIVASGVDVISTFLNNSYNTGTGSGISSSIVCGVLALIMQYILTQAELSRFSLYNEPLKTYLMTGATQSSLYTYPNISQGYGILNFQNTIMRIAENIN